MSILKSVLAALVAGGAALALSATAFAATTPAGPLTIKLTCDTGSGGSGTFKVTANSASSMVTVKCRKSASVTNAAWQAGSSATIHQTAATASGQLKAKDVKVTLTAAGETVTIRNFRAASASVTTLAQTGGGVPVLSIALALIGLAFVGAGARVSIRAS